MKPRIALTMGDYNGIGPEVVLKAAISQKIRRICVPVLIGTIDVFEYYAQLYKMKILLKEVRMAPKFNSDAVPIIPLRSFERHKIKPGKISGAAGRLALESIVVASVLNLRNEIQGMVTGPISKEAAIIGGINFTGQTEILAYLAKSKDYEMILVSDSMRVGLVTIHIPIRDVTESLSKKLIIKKINVLLKSLQQDFDIKNPKVAVLGLNPHAGEGGFIGAEETKLILPAVRHFQKQGIKIDGPFASDGFYGTHSYKNYDAVLAMYHDQGLIPLKLLGFDKGVNFTAGIDILRTSPDHGTAYNIAGKGMANPDSTIEAIKLAVKISKNRKIIFPVDKTETHKKTKSRGK